MHAYEILFSPTGGTAKVAAALTTDWSSVKTIDLSIPSTHYEDICLESDSLAVIAMPAFGGAAPQLALDRLSRIHGNGALCVIAAVYGNRAYEDTLVLLEDYAQTAGFQVIAAVSAVAEHSIIHQYAAGRPNSADCQELAAFGRQILQKAISGNRSVPEIPGNRPSKHSETGMVPNVKHSCTSCGLCAQKMSCRCNSSEQLQNHGQNQVHLLHALCIPLSSTRKRSKSCYDCSCRKNIEKILYAGKSKRAVFVKKYRRTQVSPTVFYIKHIKKQNKMLKVKCSFLNDKFFLLSPVCSEGSISLHFRSAYFSFTVLRGRMHRFRPTLPSGRNGDLRGRHPRSKAV